MNKALNSKSKRALIIANEDYRVLTDYVKGIRPKAAFDQNNALLLQSELDKALLVDQQQLPADVVRLNSRVKIKDAGNDKLLELVLVLPEKADIKQKKISVFAPLGTALIGFRKGEKVSWQVPAGKKTFTILEVENQISKQE